MPDTNWNALPTLSNTNLTTHKDRHYCYPHFIDKKNKTEENTVVWSRAASDKWNECEVQSKLKSAIRHMDSGLVFLETDEKNQGELHGSSAFDLDLEVFFF